MAKILVVEKDNHYRRGISDILELEGHDVISAEDGEQGRQLAQAHHPDVIISGIRLQELDGFGFLEAVRRDPATQYTIFMFITSKIEYRDINRGLRMGADDYIIMPFDPEELIERVNYRLRKHDHQIEKAHTELEQIKLLRQVDEELSYRITPHWVTMIAIDWAIRRTNAQVALMGIVDDDAMMLRIENISGQIDIVADNRLIPFNKLLSKALEKNHPIIVNDYAQSPYHPMKSDMQSAVVIPMIAEAQAIGLILLESNKVDNFLQEDTAFLSQITNRAAIAWKHAELFNQLLQQREHELRMQEMFGRFVSQEVAELIQDGEYALKGELRKVSILFCDIRGFTFFTDTHSPHEVIALLNDYLSIVVAAAQAHGGIVNKFGGDSVLIIYGAPTTLENCTYSALQTAQLIQRDLQQLNEFRQLQQDPPINAGIGIDTGQAIAGAVGTKSRQEYTVIGDSVNLASRIESLTKQFTDHNILISEFAYDDLGDFQSKFQLTDLGETDIRGKSKSIRIYGIHK